jgi:hypothetical protein
MKRETGGPRAHELPAASTEERLASLVAMLEQCRAYVPNDANAEIRQLLTLAILELRMQLHQVSDSELKELCDFMVPREHLEQDTRKAWGLPVPPYLRLVK